MSRSLPVTPAIEAYLAAVNPPEHPALKRCQDETMALGGVFNMQISAEQAWFMRTLARATNAKRAFEIGVFTGYSSTAIALELKAMHGANAHLLACDVSEEWTSKARTYWREAGVDDVIQLELRPATETLNAKLAAGEGGGFDYGFIDADKTGYDAYYEAGLKLLRPGGVMLFDNVLWSGAVVDPNNNTPDTAALRALASKAREDKRVHAAVMAIGDGILMCVKQ